MTVGDAVAQRVQTDCYEINAAEMVVIARHVNAVVLEVLEEAARCASEYRSWCERCSTARRIEDTIRTLARERIGGGG